MANDRLDLDAMVETLAEWLASDASVTDEDRRDARTALVAIGLPTILEALDRAERILRFGNSFHLIARFFADGSDEQDYLLTRIDGGKQGQQGQQGQQEQPEQPGGASKSAR